MLYGVPDLLLVMQTIRIENSKVWNGVRQIAVGSEYNVRSRSIAVRERERER